MSEAPRASGLSGRGRLVLAFVAAALGSSGAASVFTAVVERQEKRALSSEPIVELTEQTVDPAVWGRSFPVQYETFRRAAEAQSPSADAPAPHRDVSCLDCHDPRSHALRVTRRAFIEGIRQARAADGDGGYDVNARASRAQMRTFVCAQCHGGSSQEQQAVPPWTRGLRAESILAHYDSVGQADHVHEESGASLVDVRGSTFEMWTEGLHGRSGVACADCHMPYLALGGGKVSDHDVRSPLLDVSRSCQTCHRSGEGELVARVRGIQDKTALLQRRLQRDLVDFASIVGTARRDGMEGTVLTDARRLHREAQFHLAFVLADGSEGFHAPDESSRLLARARELLSQKPISSTHPTASALRVPPRP